MTCEHPSFAVHFLSLHSQIIKLMKNLLRIGNKKDSAQTKDLDLRGELDRIIDRARDENEALQSVLDKMSTGKKKNSMLNDIR